MVSLERIPFCFKTYHMFQVYQEWPTGLPFSSGLLPFLQHTLEGQLSDSNILCSGNTVSNETKCSREIYIPEIGLRLEI